MKYLIELVAASLLCCLITHEGGHILVASILGYKVKLQRPSWYNMAIIFTPAFKSARDAAIIGSAGFAASIACAIPLVGLIGTQGSVVTARFVMIYLAALFVQFSTYAWRTKRAGTTGDFDNLCSHNDNDI